MYSMVYCQLHLIANTIPYRALVFEEEDFQPMVYGYRLVPDVSEPRTMGMLKEVEEELHRRIRSKPSDSCLSDEVRFTVNIKDYGRM
jgi:hypothetical protein